MKIIIKNVNRNGNTTMSTPPQIAECEEYTANGLAEAEHDHDTSYTETSAKPVMSASNKYNKSKNFKNSLHNSHQTSFSNYNLLNTKNVGFNSNHHLNHYANANTSAYSKNASAANSAITHSHHHIQSFQSLSHMNESASSASSSARPISTMLMMKPLNRNSRRASMSELGYGKIESYNKLDKLGEV